MEYTKEIKQDCKNIIALIKDYENTEGKEEINNILIDLDLYFDSLKDNLNKIGLVV